jgi:pilus assembly protein CpaE
LAEYTWGQTLRILLVSTQEGARDEMFQALAGWGGEQRLFWVSQPDLAPARVQDVVPHVIVVDDELAGAHVLSLIKELVSRAPSAALLALVRPEGLGQARDAVLAGARGFVTKPVQAGELVPTLRQVLAPQRPAIREPAARERAPGRIVAFCAPKGGTGRTTLAINTAVSLCALTRPLVALVDADYSAPALDVALNLPADRDVTDLLPRLLRLDEELISGVLVPHVSGVQVLLAPPPADLSNPISLPQVQQILVLLKRMFDWVVVDLGLPLDEMAFAFLDGADRIVMTVLPEMVGLRNTRLMLDQLRSRGYPPEKVWLVLNRATMRGGVSPGDIEQRLGVPLSHRIPDDQALATLSINRGVPMVMSHRSSAVARAIHGFAEKLVQDAPAEGRQEARGGLLRGLLGRRSVEA